VIQQSILPRTFPPFPHRRDFDIFAKSLPAREVGGDFYDFFLIDDHRLGLVIADVSGKGVAAAIFMAVSRTFIKAGAVTGIGPAECLQRANLLLCQDNDAAMFVTAFYGVLDLGSGTLVYANAGHNRPYLLRADDSLAALPGTGGMALGIMEDLVFRTEQVLLQPGDGLFLFTDGITEATNVRDEFFGEARLETLLREARGRTPDELLGHVLSAVRTFAGTAPQSDDLTALALRYRGTPVTEHERA
jgi:sigma-B regulation protein RsbU (phosphoserine phosphatase)